ncbi:MAG: MgtC/SapB family protein, partial [Bryobacteraceae bacterium]
IAALLAVFHYQSPERSGITTEMAAVATFCLGYLASAPGVSFGSALAIGLTVAITILLEAKRAMHRFIRETITEQEFTDTLRFLAVIFIIYPVLPQGGIGPEGIFVPRQVWLFVILVSSVSYVGYFLEKFLGPRAGLRLAGVLGGLASSTAATASLARGSAEEPENQGLYWQAILLANAMQFPRVLAILGAVNPPLAQRLAPALVVMTAAALLLARFAASAGPWEGQAPRLHVRNPFRLGPALRFGAWFAAIVLLEKAASRAAGRLGVLLVSAAGGSVDADAAALSLSDLLKSGGLDMRTSTGGVLLTLVGNAVVKTAMAAQAGAAGLARRLGLAFAVMFTAGALAWLLAN